MRRACRPRGNKFTCCWPRSWNHSIYPLEDDDTDGGGQCLGCRSTVTVTVAMLLYISKNNHLYSMHTRWTDSYANKCYNVSFLLLCVRVWKWMRVLDGWLVGWLVETAVRQA